MRAISSSDSLSWPREGGNQARRPSQSSPRVVGTVGAGAGLGVSIGLADAIGRVTILAPSGREGASSRGAEGGEGAGLSCALSEPGTFGGGETGSSAREGSVGATRKLPVVNWVTVPPRLGAALPRFRTR